MLIERHAPRFGRRQAASHVVVDGHLQMRREFGVQVRIKRAFSEECPHAPRKPAEPAHAGSSPSLPMAITRSITSVSRSQ